MYTVTASQLNERTGPGTQFPRVGVLPRGTLLEIKEISADGKWALAHTGTWLSMQYLSHLSGPTRPGETAIVGTAGKMTVQIGVGSRLNVRSAASIASTIVGTLRRGDVVTVIATSGSWATIAYTREVPVAYVSLNYIR